MYCTALERLSHKAVRRAAARRLQGAHVAGVVLRLRMGPSVSTRAAWVCQEAPHRASAPSGPAGAPRTTSGSDRSPADQRPPRSVLVPAGCRSRWHTVAQSPAKDVCNSTPTEARSARAHLRIRADQESEQAAQDSYKAGHLNALEWVLCELCVLRAVSVPGWLPAAWQARARLRIAVNSAVGFLAGIWAEGGFQVSQAEPQQVALANATSRRDQGQSSAVEECEPALHTAAATGAALASR